MHIWGFIGILAPVVTLFVLSAAAAERPIGGEPARSPAAKGSARSLPPEPGEAESGRGAAGEASASAQATLAEADAAFDAGDHDRALAIYLGVLKQTPDDLRALRRAGLLLGWASRPGEAIPLLEKAVTLDPYDRATRQQLARVYSWDRRFDQSVHIYDRLLAEDPDDVDCAVERARVLSWEGRLAEAEAAYRKILQKRFANTQARLGLAQTLAWQGRLDEAETVYRGLEWKDPADARLGLGRLRLLRGDAGGALRVAREALAADPKSGDARDLERDALARLGPTLQIAAEHSKDTDENANVSASATLSLHPGGLFDLDITGRVLHQQGKDAAGERCIPVLGPTPPPGAKPGEIAACNGLAAKGLVTDATQSLTSESLGAAIGFAVGERSRAGIGIAGERLGGLSRGDRSALTGWASWRIVTEPVIASLTLAREVPKWTAFVTDQDLRLDEARLVLEGPLLWRIRWSVAASAGRITGGSDDNTRSVGVASAWRSFDLGGPSLTIRYSLRYLAYDLNLDDGYFDPQRYLSNVLGAELGGSLPGASLEWGIGAEVGLERFHQDGEDRSVLLARTDPVSSDTNTIFGYSGRLAWNAGEAFTLELRASHIESAAQTASGFATRTIGLDARIRF